MLAAAANQGGGGPPPVTANFTLQPTSDHTRRRASLEGTHGHTAAGRYLRIPSGDGGVTPDRYVFFTKNDGSGRFVGIDPGPIAAELSGYIGIEVQLGAGNVTAAQRATATRAALTGLYTIGGSGAVVSVTGQIGTCTTGGIFGGTRGLFGTRRNVAQFNSSPLNTNAVGQFGTWSGGSVRITALGIHLTNTSSAVRLSLYSGGTQASLAGTTRLTEVLIPSGGASGWNWRVLTPSEVAVLSNGNFRLVAKSNGASTPGYIGNVDLVGTDFPDSGGGATYPLEIYNAGVPIDPTTSFPASLSGAAVDSTANVYVMIAFQYVAADGTSGVFTTRFGVHISTVTDLSQTSSLLVPDAGGANLFMSQVSPDILGMELAAHAVAIGTQHTTQFRPFVVQGGTRSDLGGAVVLWDGVATAGSGTNQWVETAVSGSVPVAANTVIAWAVRNNAATVNLRFALNVNRETADPEINPADWDDQSEFEIFTDNTAHSTNPAVAVESPISTSVGTPQQNTNYPGSYLVLRVPADIAA